MQPGAPGTLPGRSVSRECIRIAVPGAERLTRFHSHPRGKRGEHRLKLHRVAISTPGRASSFRQLVRSGPRALPCSIQTPLLRSEVSSVDEVGVSVPRAYGAGMTTQHRVRCGSDVDDVTALRYCRRCRHHQRRYFGPGPEVKSPPSPVRRESGALVARPRFLVSGLLLFWRQTGVQG